MKSVSFMDSGCSGSDFCF